MLQPQMSGGKTRPYIKTDQCQPNCQTKIPQTAKYWANCQHLFLAAYSNYKASSGTREYKANESRLKLVQWILQIKL